MDMNKFILSIVLMILPFLQHAQSIEEAEIELFYYCDVMVNAAEPKHRISAGKEFEQLFLKVLEDPSSFQHAFDSLKWISKKYPADRSFRLFTWEIFSGTGDNSYFGVIQKSDGSIFVLNDQFKEAEDLAESEYGSDQWLGSVCYNLTESADAQGIKYYMLYGLHRWSRFEHIKLVDILFFTREGIPYFGKPVFRQKLDDGSFKVSHRLLFRYAADAQFTLNYNAGMAMIMCDHLMKRMGRIPGQGETMIPDGTYVGFEKADGYWNFVEQIAIEPMDQAPRPNPILDERKGKKIFGNQ
jgi:hypothetical protein